MVGPLFAPMEWNHIFMNKARIFFFVQKDFCPILP